jgi:hypothetical protein
MRLVVTLLMGMVMVVGCATEQPRPVVGEDELTAAHLRNLQEDQSALRYLEPTEEEARALAEEELAKGNVTPGQETWAENRDLEEEPTREEKVSQASIAILQVAVTLGAMVAPYFLF